MDKFTKIGQIMVARTKELEDKITANKKYLRKLYPDEWEYSYVQEAIDEYMTELKALNTLIDKAIL